MMNANGRPGHRLFHSVQYTRTAASHAYFSCRVRTGTYIALEYAVPLASAPDSCHHVNVLPLVCSATNNRRCHNWRRTSRWAATPVKRPDANHTPRCVRVLLSVADDSESSVAAASTRGAAQDCSHSTIPHLQAARPGFRRLISGDPKWRI